MNGSLLKLDRVCFSYGDRRALEDITLEIRRGEIVGLAGPNGAGKTTLLRLIMGLLKPSSGRIEFLNGMGAFGRGKIGYLSQYAQQIDSDFPATVQEVVGTGLYGKVGILRRLGPADRRAVADSIRNVGLGRLSEARMDRLSGGQVQRAFIARALVSNPSLLILDEPTTGVDMSGEEEFYRLIAKLNRLYGIAVLLVSHDVYALLEHTDRIVFLNKRIMYDESPRKLDSAKLLSMLFYHKHPKGVVERMEKSMRAGFGTRKAEREGR